MTIRGNRRRRARERWNIANRWPSPDGFRECQRADEALRRYLVALGCSSARVATRAVSGVRFAADTSSNIITKPGGPTWFLLVDLAPEVAR